MRLKYLIMMLIFPMFTIEYIDAAPTLKNLFKIPGKLNPDNIKQNFKENLRRRVSEVLNDSGEKDAHKILISNVLKSLERSQGLISYGTQISKVQLDEFISVFEGLKITNDPEVIATIVPGLPKAGTIEPEQDRNPLENITLKFSMWLDFLREFARTTEMEGDYFISNSVSIYREWKEIVDLVIKELEKEDSEKKKEEEKEIEAEALKLLEQEERETKAATKIQSVVKGHFARKKFIEAKEKAKKEKEEQDRLKQEEQKKKSEESVLEGLVKTGQLPQIQRVRRKDRRPPTEHKIGAKLDTKDVVAEASKSEQLGVLIKSLIYAFKEQVAEPEIQMHQAIKENKLDAQRLVDIKKDLLEKINKVKDYLDFTDLLSTATKQLYETNKDLEKDIKMVVDTLNILFSSEEEIKQLADKILAAVIVVLKLEPKECIDKIVNLIENTALTSLAGAKIKIYDKQFTRLTEKEEKLKPLKDEVLSLINRLVEVTTEDVLKGIVKDLDKGKFDHLSKAFDEFKYTDEERSQNTKLDILIKSILSIKQEKEQARIDQEKRDEEKALEEREAQEKVKQETEKLKAEKEAKAKQDVIDEWKGKLQELNALTEVNFSDLGFIKDVKYDRSDFKGSDTSAKIFELLKNFCKNLETKDDKFIDNLQKLLISVKNKTFFNNDQKILISDHFEYVKFYVNYLKPIYIAKDLNVDGIFLSTSQSLTSRQRYVFQNPDNNPNLDAIKKSEQAISSSKNLPRLGQSKTNAKLDELLSKMVKESIVTSDTLKIIHYILTNILGEDYSAKSAFAQFLSKSISEKTQSEAVAPKVPRKPAVKPDISGLSQKLIILKQSLAKLKSNLTKLENNLGILKNKIQQKGV